MSTKNFILSSLLCILCAGAVNASDCTDDDCVIEPVILDEFVPAEQDIVIQEEIQVIPAQNLKILTIKPKVQDDRPPLWDGTQGEYKQKLSEKTVDWRNGVPIWDDSIASYRYKDFSDWFLEPAPEFFVDDIKTSEPFALYEQNMQDAKETMERVEELLAPKKPSDDIWWNATPKPEYTAQDLTVVVQETFASDDGCPFETDTECEIWRKKPIVRETVSPRSPKLRDAKMCEFINAVSQNQEIDATHPAARPLLERYKMLMVNAQACCTDGMAHALQQAGADAGLIYKFLADDANFYGFGGRCLMMTDYDLDTKYPNTATAVVAADVRNGCLCRGRQWFKAMLAPFEQAYKAVPGFKEKAFYYTYIDGLKREVTVSVNNDVQNVLKQLEQCP